MIVLPPCSPISMTPDFRVQLQSTLASMYDIDRELTGGGMSRVFVATERSLGRSVVIKVLPPDLSAGVNRERFRREIQLAAQLHHPHIVPLFSAGETGELLYYTMPYIEGESLRAMLERQKTFSVREVARVLHDVVDALAYAHTRGIIHRDIKPGNVLTLGVHALVTDFGVAKAISASLPVVGLTTAGIAIGTPAYMAPEQLAGDPHADHRVDIYAAGLLAYELLTGESPFSASSPQATMAAQLTRTPEPLHVVRPDVPPALSAIIMRCLEKQPESRPESAESLLAELDEVATPQSGVLTSTLPAAVPPIAADNTRVLPAVRRPRSMRAAAFGIGALLVAAIGGTAWETTRQSRQVDARRDSLRADSTRLAADAGRGTAGDSRRSGDAARSGAGVGRGEGTGSPLARTSAMDDSAGQRAVVVPQAMRAPLVLSRADSLAIAEAVRKRAGTPETEAPQQSIPLESLRVEFQRAIGDSMRHALEALRNQNFRVDVPDAKVNVRPDPRPLIAIRPATPMTSVTPMLLPPTSGRLRVAMARLQNSTDRNNLDTLGRMLADSLGKLLRGSHPFDVVSAGTSRAAAASAGDPIALGWTLRADLVIAGVYYVLNDELRMQLHVYDIKRGNVIQVIHAEPGTVERPFANLHESARALTSELAEIAGRIGQQRARGLDRERRRNDLERQNEARTRARPVAPKPPLPPASTQRPP